ncbi:hypothetical protein BH11MYX2_BH11MYX2_31970 [soil metagenome]
MNDLSPTTRALLDAARSGLGPDRSAVARMRSGVATKVAGSAAASALAFKIGLACILAAAGVTAAVHYTRSSPTHVIESPPVSPVESSPVVHIAAPPVAHVLAAPALAPSVVPPPASRADLSREVALIDSASAALAKGTPLAAIETIKQYAAETHGAGQLAEEAAAIETEATCAAKLSDAGTKLAAFDTRYPRSSQRARLVTACK